MSDVEGERGRCSAQLYLSLHISSDVVNSDKVTWSKDPEYESTSLMDAPKGHFWKLSSPSPVSLALLLRWQKAIHLDHSFSVEIQFKSPTI